MEVLGGINGLFQQVPAKEVTDQKEIFVRPVSKLVYTYLEINLEINLSNKQTDRHNVDNFTSGN